MHGNLSTVKKLIQAGDLKPDIVDCCGNTPLLDALRMGHKEIVKILVYKQSSNIHFKDNLGRSSLHLAAEANQNSIIEMLLNEFNFDIEDKSNKGKFFLNRINPFML